MGGQERGKGLGGVEVADNDGGVLDVVVDDVSRRGLKGVGRRVRHLVFVWEFAGETGEVEIRPFDPWQAKDTAYPITTYQPLLWSVNSIGEAFGKMNEFVRSMG